jgi:hypothetical protein
MENDVRDNSSTECDRIRAEIMRHGVVHDYADVLALGVDEVLKMYNLGAPAGEGDALFVGLCELGADRQTREIERLVPSGCLDGMDAATPSPSQLENERKVLLGASREERDASCTHDDCQPATVGA